MKEQLVPTHGRIQGNQCMPVHGRIIDVKEYIGCGSIPGDQLTQDHGSIPGDQLMSENTPG